MVLPRAPEPTAIARDSPATCVRICTHALPRHPTHCSTRAARRGVAADRARIARRLTLTLRVAALLDALLRRPASDPASASRPLPRRRVQCSTSARTAAVASRPAPRATHRPPDQKETTREEEPSRRQGRLQMAHHRDPGARDARGDCSVSVCVVSEHGTGWVGRVWFWSLLYSNCFCFIILRGSWCCAATHIQVYSQVAAHLCKTGHRPERGSRETPGCSNRTSG